MRRIFLDTSYLKALADRSDNLHQRAQSVSQQLGVYVAVSSEMVLTELLNAFSGRGEYSRGLAIAIANKLRGNPNTEIVPQTHEMFEKALKFYEQRMDKGYSLTDCASMLIMREQEIRDVLTYDKHFQQEGFNALLREN